MINIVLDTNILHQEGINSGRMKVLKTLTDSKVVKLFIPEIVKREFCTKRTSSIKESFEKALSNFKNIHKKIEFENGIKTKVVSMEADIQKMLASVESTISEEFANWEADLGVEILPFIPEDIGIVLDDYFTGSGVFKSIKNRDDIPDSMIHKSICRLTDRYEESYLVIKDSVFKKCMDNHPKVVVLDSLSDFLKLDIITEHIANEHLKQYFEGKGFSTLLSKYLVTQENMLEQVYIPDGNILNTDLIDDYIFNAEINFPQSNNIQYLSIANFYAISKTEFTAEISFTTTAPVHFISDYGSYLELSRDNSRDIDMDSMNGDGMCDLYETYRALFCGKIELTLAQEYDVEGISTLMGNLCNDDSQLDVILNIETAKLLESIF